MQRFFVEPSSINNDKVVLSHPQAHQIRDVLRLKVGDGIIILDNAGWEYAVTLTEVTSRQTVGGIIEKRPATGEPRTHITLYQGMPAREKFEYILQKCTEVGVCEFVPVITQRSVVRGSAGQNRTARWRRIITEAAEQSGRGRIPELRDAVEFDKAVHAIAGFERCIIAAVGAKGAGLREVLHCGQAAPVRIAVFIGPEGGFTDDEIRLACEKGATPVWLGERILRTETAAIVTSALILYELGEMGP
jgi:16S rRNA (uracil1498-N3)-methyltransferase